MAKIRSTVAHNWKIGGIGLIGPEFREISDEAAKQFVGRSGFEVIFGKLSEVAEPIMAAKVTKAEVPAGVLGTEAKLEKPIAPTEGSAGITEKSSFGFDRQKFNKFQK